MAVDALYVTARRVLLDALEALVDHRDALVVIGAQAVYMHTPEDDLAVAPTTTDADLGLDPDVLGDSPLLEAVLPSAGFTLTGEPGIWMSPHGSTVDLIVPESLAGSGRRGARLGPQGKKTARRAAGIEGCLVDKQVIAIKALEEGDERTSMVAVAGPAALTVAKVHKIAGRRDEGRGRLNDKDALDIYRLMRSVAPSAFASGFELLAESRLAATPTEWAVREFGGLFGETQSLGVEMVVRATEGLIPEAEVRAACPILAHEILAATGLQGPTPHSR